MSVISHSCIFAGTVPLKQVIQRPNRNMRLFFKSKGQITETPQSPACKVLCFTLRLLDPGLASSPAVEGKEMFPVQTEVLQFLPRPEDTAQTHS